MATPGWLYWVVLILEVAFAAEDKTRIPLILYSIIISLVHVHHFLTAAKQLNSDSFYYYSTSRRPGKNYFERKELNNLEISKY